MRRLLLAGLLSGLLVAGCSDDGDADAGVDPGAGSGAVAGGDGGADSGLASVIADVERLAPALESVVRGTPYPQTLDEAVDALADADLAPSPGNTVGGYVYDPADVEFALCIENESGAWALYDTAPMSTRSSGESGGCPA